MKKISIILVVFFLIVLCFINNVNAENVETFSVTVSNVNGTNYYKNVWDNEQKKSNLEVAGSYDYGTEIQLDYFNSLYEDGNNYYLFYNDDGMYYINENDVTAIVKEGEDNTYDSNTKNEFLVVSDVGLKMYKGPRI